MSPSSQVRFLRLTEKFKAGKSAQKQMFLARFKRYFPELEAGLEAVYGDGTEDVLAKLFKMLQSHDVARPEDLRALDLTRSLAPDWFERPEMIGYVCYGERFAQNLAGIPEHLDYLEELGVKYFHLMPFLKPRPAPHDGGYAVMDYRAVREDLGNMDDLENLTKDLRARGMSLCADLVLNHVAQEHDWAQKARAGNQKYQDYFLMFPDRNMPDQYEQTLPEVFPDFAPGNFTFNDPAKAWVWTTFNSWQWDLNWANPNIFLEFVDIILWLANKGVEIFRLDAIAFIWKRLGTNSQNQPEVHAITQALRAAVRVVAPGVLFKAEAIVSPDDLIHYLGRGEHFGKVSDLAYHNSLMVQIWSTLASRDTRLMTQALRAFPAKPTSTAWGSYLRCHDDIGWAIDDNDANAVGMSGAGHRKFLSDYYSGDFPGSHARGLVFQENKKTGDRRISGTGASLAGLELAEETNNPEQIHLSLERLLLGHAIVLAWGGIPLLYMGDELAMANDYGFTKNPEHAPDNRWVHRPNMDWARAKNAQQNPESVAGKMYWGLRQLLEVRQHRPQFHAAVESVVLEPQNPHVFIFERNHPTAKLICLFNFSEHEQHYPSWQLRERGFDRAKDCISGQQFDITDSLRLPPYARLWLLAE